MSTKSQELTQTREFLRQCMAAVVTGDLSHAQAKDVAMLAQQQNYNMALESTLFSESSSSSMLDSAKALLNDNNINLEGDPSD